MTTIIYDPVGRIRLVLGIQWTDWQLEGFGFLGKHVRDDENTSVESLRGDSAFKVGRSQDAAYLDVPFVTSVPTSSLSRSWTFLERLSWCPISSRRREVVQPSFCLFVFLVCSSISFFTCISITLMVHGNKCSKINPKIAKKSLVM